ncbi:TPA: NAD(P)-dependent alcohol dehydrogenase [Vibrio alginolyticus]|uniref:NADPH-dependent aldehyde reductase Ahr n=1 Tax=Vibrio TaxID=662 RepID=UPI00215C6181|nr:MULTISPECIES: NAD(P)-dependent alcohol dehydrogenase [Vibrio]ELB2737484.1 NAD(P)-dependent alcohol dehydrogenase [Vibrio alginolyticus]ELB2760821.1 NAD(P)-dependent alcohol dehydrogenase [Vibrio alginolyticus]ELB2798277.1 NAD(P)-dependent alcohol dehydrogenase [Vibrio alginolyticus]ELB2831708.1 NAD(P)-dependent alcohol dehydrogenase [Vibrio alginolyticus]MCR9600049.1 NAD(P)-dependent alcohol dehydrogenase [Vibrio alginolyticus]
MYKAYAANGAGQPLTAVERELPELQQNQVVIDVQYCGVCHSDLSMLDNEWGLSQFPLVPGHEVVGKVSAVGVKVHNIEVGQTVGLGWNSDYCHTCSDCMSGDHNLCGDAEITMMGRDGGFAEKVVADASAVMPIPSKLDPKAAGPLLCAGITVFNPLVQFDIKPTDKVAVIGIGGLGHLAIQFMKAWGCEVTAFTSSEEKKKEAMEFGASDTINSRDPEDIAKAANRFDYIISTVGAKLDWNLYISTLKAKGRLHFVGATTDPLDISVIPMIFGQKTISASPVGSPVNIKRMLDFAAHHDIKPAIELYKFDDINEAIERVKSGKARYRVVLER